MIQLMNLTAAPPTLQRMLLHLQNYDLHIKYEPGKEILLADGLESSLILKGQVVTPESMQKYILNKIHEGHHGMEKCKLRAKDCVYWINMNNGIESIVNNCPTCQEFQKTQPKETLKLHEIATCPWQIVGTDIFHYESNDYLIIADYYSKFPYIRKMPSQTAAVDLDSNHD